MLWVSCLSPDSMIGAVCLSSWPAVAEGGVTMDGVSAALPVLRLALVRVGGDTDSPTAGTTVGGVIGI